MALSLIATPIGHPKDLTLHALERLNGADLIIGEDQKNASRFLKSLGITNKTIDVLNEHSRPDDFKFFSEECRSKEVVLISDCGTPGFCDPGRELVALCRKNQILVRTVPGASCLMVFLSGCGHDLNQFYFRGFLPAKEEQRQQELKRLQKLNMPIVLMDTPYRLNRLLDDLIKFFPDHKACLGLDLTKDSEEFVTDSLQQLKEKFDRQKREFVLAIFR